MRYLHFLNPDDMQQIGVHVLGQYDPYGLRVLCDLTAEGARLVSDYYGHACDFAENWNTYATASTWLHRNALFDLAEFACLRLGCQAVLREPERVMGLFDPELVAQYEEFLLTHPRPGSYIRKNPRPAGPVLDTRTAALLHGRLE